MSHISYRARGEDLDLDVDHVVVGSGAGGATAAATLARAGASVALVESGAWRDPEDYPNSCYGGLRDMMPSFGALVTQGRTLWPIVQGKGVGGTTLVNSAICIRTPGDVFADWQRDTGVGGDLEAPIGRIQDELERELSAEETPTDAMGRTNDLAILGAERVGYASERTVRFARGCTGQGRCLTGCKTGKKQSLNLVYAPEVLARGQHVVSCAPVDRVLVEGGRATGVTGWFSHPGRRERGARFTVRARKSVIVAASVVWTPLLLWRSGLKSPALGAGFCSHPGTGIFGVYDEPVDMNRGATQGWSTLAFRSERLKLESLSVPPELVASRLSGGGVELMRRLAGYRHLSMWVMAVRAQSRGTVRPGWFGEPVVRYTLDATDMERMRHGAWLVARTHVAAGAKGIVTGVYGMPYMLGADEVDKIKEAPLEPRNWTAILSHLFGGCRMGADPARSVCDGRGRVHGVPNLVIGDASQIPGPPGINPQHTIMALGRLRATQILETS